MKKDHFIVELLTSFPFKVLVVLVIFIVAGIAISKCRERNVRMKEDILYIQPKRKA